MATERRRMTYMTLDELTPADRNAKRHDASAVAGSVERFGYMEPVVLDERTGQLVAGHGRREELIRRRDAGEAPPDGIVAQAGKWLVPVVRGWRSRDDAEALAAGVALNRTTELGGWDLSELVPLLDDLRRSEGGLDGVGFTPDDLDDLLRDAPPEPKPERPDDEDANPIGPVEDPITRRGDLWLCGPHRVKCGDSFDVDDRASLLDGVTPAAGVMDPPFAIYGSASGISSSVADDKMVRPFFEQLGRVLFEVLPEYAHLYVCCDWRSYATLWDGFRSAGLTPKNCLVWDKGSGGLGSNWANTYEMVAYLTRMPPERAMKGARRTGARIVNKSNVLRFPRVRGEERQHNAAKPIAMLAGIIEAATDEAEWVVDLFGGSGAVLAAGHTCGRLTATMEYEPGWVDVICRRYQRLTGELPTRDGEAHDFIGAP